MTAVGEKAEPQSAHSDHRQRWTTPAIGAVALMLVQREHVPALFERLGVMSVVLESLTIASAAMLAARLIVTHRGRPLPAQAALTTVGLLWIALAVSMLWSRDAGMTSSRIGDLLAAGGMVIVIVAIFLLGRSTDDPGLLRRTLVVHAALFLVLSAVVAVVPVTDVLYGPEWLGFGEGIAGIFTHKNINGEALVVAGLVFAGVAATNGSTPARATAAALAVATLVVAATGGARTATASILAGFALLIVLAVRPTAIARRTLGRTIVAAYTALWLVVVPWLVLGSEGSLLNSREFLWREILDDLWPEKLIGGYGYGAYWLLAPERRPVGFEFAVDAHNGILELVIDAGVLALIGGAGLSVLWARALVRSLDERTETHPSFIALLAAAPLMAVTEAFIFSPGRILFGALVASMLIATASPQRSVVSP